MLNLVKKFNFQLNPDFSRKKNSKKVLERSLEIEKEITLAAIVKRIFKSEH